MQCLPQPAVSLIGGMFEPVPWDANALSWLQAGQRICLASAAPPAAHVCCKSRAADRMLIAHVVIHGSTLWRILPFPCSMALQVCEALLSPDGCSGGGQGRWLLKASPVVLPSEANSSMQHPDVSHVCGGWRLFKGFIRTCNFLVSQLQGFMLWLRPSETWGLK